MREVVVVVVVVVGDARQPTLPKVVDLTGLIRVSLTRMEPEEVAILQGMEEMVEGMASMATAVLAVAAEVIEIRIPKWIPIIPIIMDVGRDVLPSPMILIYLIINKDPIQT